MIIPLDISSIKQLFQFICICLYFNSHVTLSSFDIGNVQYLCVTCCDGFKTTQLTMYLQLQQRIDHFKLTGHTSTLHDILHGIHEDTVLDIQTDYILVGPNCKWDKQITGNEMERYICISDISTLPNVTINCKTFMQITANMTTIMRPVSVQIRSKQLQIKTNGPIIQLENNIPLITHSVDIASTVVNSITFKYIKYLIPYMQLKKTRDICLSMEKGRIHLPYQVTRTIHVVATFIGT